MNRRLLISVLAVSFITTVSTGILCAYTELDTAAVIRAEGQIPFTPGALLDDFSIAASINVWNASTGTFSKSTVTPTPANEKCAASYTNDPGTENGRTAGNCLKLDYNVSRPFNPALPEDATNYGTYAGYSSRLGGTSLGSPLPGTSLTPTAISFYVKGVVGGEFFKIQLKNATTQASVYITDYLDGGVTTAWQKVTIPFHNFVNLGNVGSWGNMAEFVIVFENSQSTTNESPTSGTIYIDDITFETTPITVVRVDHFGDKLGTCALGGNMGTGVGGGASESLNKYSFSNTTNEYDPEGYPYGMRLDYNVTSGSAYTFIIFGGGSTGWIAVPHDFSAYTKLTFKIRAKSEAENPKLIKIELVDSVGAKIVAIDRISSTIWQTYELPFSGFDSFHKTSIKQLTFVFDDWITGAKAGVVFIDSIQFE